MANIGRTVLRNTAPAAAIVVVSTLSMGALALRMPMAGEPVALLFSESLSEGESLARIAGMDARLVRDGGWDRIKVVSFDRGFSLLELWRNGVWAAFDPVVAAGCAPAGPNKEASNGVG